MSVTRWLVAMGIFFGFCLVAIGQEEEEDRLVFPVNGFSIAPLEAPTPSAPCAPLAMSLPPIGGLAANVNVRIQPYSGSMAEYVALSREQFQKLNFFVIEIEVESDSSARLEYSGTLRSRPLHWYARAFKRGDRVYLVTGTALEEQWSTMQTLLKRCVDSFRLE